MDDVQCIGSNFVLYRGLTISDQLDSYIISNLSYLFDNCTISMFALQIERDVGLSYGVRELK